MNTPPGGGMADGIVSPATPSQISTEGAGDVTNGDDVTKTDANVAAGNAECSGGDRDQKGTGAQPSELMQGDQARSSSSVDEPCCPLPVRLEGSGKASVDNNLDVDADGSSSSITPTDSNPSVTTMAPELKTDSVLSAAAVHVISDSSSLIPSKVPFQSKLQTALLNPSSSSSSSLLPALQFSQPNVLTQDVATSSADAATRPGTSRPLKCPYCNWHYKYTETLQTHILEEHTGEDSNCHTCLSGRPHPRLPRGEAHRCGYKPYRCDVCKYATTTKGNLRIHNQSDKHFYNTRALQRHAAEQAGAVRGCQISETASNDASVKERLSAASSHVNGTAEAVSGEAAAISASEKAANGALSAEALQQCLRPAPEPGPSNAADPVTDEAPKNSMIRRLLEIGPRPDSLKSQKCDPVPVRPPKQPSPTPVFTCGCCKSFSSNSIEHLDGHWHQTHSKADTGFQSHTATSANAVPESHSVSKDDTKEHIPGLQCSAASVEKKRESSVVPGSDSACSGQLQCNLCDYRASSAADLREHASAAEHDARLVLLQHLQEAERRLSNPAGWTFECILCGFSSHHKLPLLWHIGGVDHLAQEHKRQLKRLAEGRRGGGDIEEIFNVRTLDGKSGHNVNIQDRIGTDSASKKQKEPRGYTGHPSLGSLTPVKCKPENNESINGSLSSMGSDKVNARVSGQTNSDSCRVSGTLQDGTGSDDHSTNGDGVLSLKESVNHQKGEDHGDENRPYKCHDCHVAYAHPQILNIHLNSQLHCSNALKRKSGASCAQSVQNESVSLINHECEGIHQLQGDKEAAKAPSKCRDSVKGDILASPEDRESDTPRAVSRPASATQHKLLQELGLDIVLHHGENSRKRQKVIQDQEQDSMEISGGIQDLQSISDTSFVCVVCQKHFTNALILKVHEEEVHKLLLADHVLDGFAQKFAQKFQHKREAKSDAGLLRDVGRENANTRASKMQDPSNDSQLLSISPSPVDLRSESQSQNPQSQTSHLQAQHLESHLVQKGGNPQDQHLLKTTESTAPKAGAAPETTSILKRLVEQKPVTRPASQQIRQVTGLDTVTSVPSSSPAGDAGDYVAQITEACRSAADFPAALSFLQAAQLHYQLQQLSALGATVGADAQQAALGPLMAAQQMWAAYTVAAQQQAAVTAEALNVPEDHAEEKVSCKRSRTRISAQQVTVLRAYFDVDPSPLDDQITGLAVCCGLPPKVVKQWFRNTLFKERQKQRDAPCSDDSSAQGTEKERSGDVCPTKGSLPTVLSSVTPKVVNHNVLPSYKTKGSERNIKESSETKITQMKVAGSGVNCIQNTIGSSQSKTSPHQPTTHPSPEGCNSKHEASLPVNLTSHAPRASPTEELRVSFASCASTSSFPTTSNSPTSSTSSDLSPVQLGDQNNGARRANRTRFSNRQVKELQQAFEKNAYPRDDELVRLSERLDLCVRVITVWFQNARQKARRVFENQSPKATGVTVAAAEHKCNRCERVFQSHLELVLHQNEPCHQALSASAVDARGAQSPVIRVDENADTGKSMATPQNNMYQCNKCSQRFARFDQWREHDAAHMKSPSPIPSPLQNQLSEGSGAEPRPETGSTTERIGSSGCQRQDMRVRTVINAEALEYLHRQYRLDPSPSRDVVESISRHIGIKKRVVQVWFQNARARERKSQANGQQSGAQNRVTDQADVTFSTGSSVEAGSQSLIQQQMQAYMEALVAAQQVTMGMASNGPIDPILGIPGLGYPPGFYGHSLATAECEEAPLDLSKPQKSPDKSILASDSSDGLSAAHPQLDAIRSDSVSIVPVFATTSQSQHQALDLATQPSLQQQQQQQQQPKQPCQKRFRTQMSATQVAVLRSVFNAYKMPTMLECMRLGERIGLAKRVVQVWFQNSRAKQKKRQLLRNDERALTPPPQGCEYCSVAYDDKCKAQEHVLSDCHVTSVCRVSKVTGVSGGGAGAGQRPREVSGPSEEEQSRRHPPQGGTSHAPQPELETAPPSER